jgi:hypothetical protein
MVDDSIYFNTFQREPDGEKILSELSALFYDCDLHVKGDPYETAYRTGRREVIRYILMRCAQAKLPNEEQQ